MTIVLAASVWACGITSESAGPALSWSIPLGGATEAGWIGEPAIAGDLGFVQADDGIRAYRLSSGEEAWRRALTPSGTFRSDNIAAAAGRVFAATSSVYALDAATGHLDWIHPLGSSATLCEIAADEAAVYAGADLGLVLALDVTSGAPFWTQTLGSDWGFGGVVTGISVSGDTVYVGAIELLSPSGHLRRAHAFALERTSGEVLWHYVAAGETNDINAAPRLAGRLLLFGDVYGGSFFALDRTTGLEVWRVHIAPGRPGPSRAPRERDGIVYSGTQAGVYAVKLASGKLVWKQEGDEFLGINDVAFCGETLVAQSLSLRTLDPDSGRLLHVLLDSRSGSLAASDFGVSPTHLLVMGNDAVYGIACGG